ncbi:adenylate/guanylate cyclase domain-containing protein [Anabaena sp. FACHB-709]|uniref:Adenylate cyclase n=4 Tax=Nostocaceae TaxID=1162 RepID=A0A1Z4KRW4_ANAVA|nr:MULTISPECIES: adenylate/guanylate cyclase domain-containing protein [Nostocaceae]BAY71718.1 adenylate cyclase [Trichormus variabilis NIES-23]HBW30621.1 adenylate cyclase [Nostoc sp. UBA8866]MBD2172375.1 FHA domain-containing protein [Anabaena cylindrica FACHB-318]MBD2263804.1 FHA domain-containing protein [Anabaena sp. FACHB-709]MBD2273315.1 FHA domain-containing protein [Nostoc sp. PCC 7120 = FACHB-418]
MTELTLRLQQGDTETTVTVNRDVFTIGRLPECNLYLPFAGVSRKHAQLVKKADGKWIIEDLGSKNGTQVNQSIVSHPRQLQHGDVIWLGNVNLVVLLQTPLTVVSIKPVQPSDVGEQRTIFRSAKQLQQQWIEANSDDGDISNKNKTIARLKDLVDIAKNLCAAASIEEIFFQVQQVVFRYLGSIDRLALLIDVNGCGHLELVNAGTRSKTQQQYLLADASWISRSICQKVFEEKIVIQTADTHKDERFSSEHSILLKGIRSAMAVPLWDENKVVGVLYADAHLSSYHWERDGEEELSFFSALANLVASSVQRWLLAEKLKTEEVIRHRLERYHSPAVVQQLISIGGLPDGRLPPAESEISILFADLVGFTAISERLTPTAIAQLLNNLFEEMLQEVFACGGTLDKYIGDCIMAFFGAPEPQADHADRATAAAKAMLIRMEHLNANGFWQEPLQLRIAINSGKAVVGDVGSSQRVEYTALGGTINLAARMEAICPPSECVISEATYELLSQRYDFQKMGDYRFKGIDRLVKVYQTKLQQVTTIINH